MNHKLNLLLAAVAASSALAISQPAQAATTLSNYGTSYIRKGQYRIHLKSAGRITVNTSAKYEITNTLDWEAIPYAGSNKKTKTFYLRAGNYKLTTSAKKYTPIKINYTKLTKLVNSLADYTVETKSAPKRIPTDIKMGQTVRSFDDIFKKYHLSGQKLYQFTIDKPQKVTLNYSAMPIYYPDDGNIYSKSEISIEPVTNYSISPESWKMIGLTTNKKHSWYLAKGTYVIEFSPGRGRYSFSLSSEDADASQVIPNTPTITDITPVDEGLKVTYSKVANATSYALYSYQKPDTKIDIYNFDFTYPVNKALTRNSNGRYSYPADLTQIILKNQLINGNTYYIAVRGVNGQYFGDNSEPIKYTYYASSNNSTGLSAPVLTTSYYDDNGSDEPYISMKWDKIADADSYEVGYHLKGAKWHYYMVKSNWEEITPSLDAGKDLKFTKGDVYELKVRAYHGSQAGPWSKVKNITVNVTPAGY